ncbi:Hypothetical predicted protein [Paramuricea clavata]|uniref:Uncharacterized protein n=1 Tax=Paramuricea clavata TaxID=317549 RepID=A0A6S7HTW5_PARCT|nr:Hypothetical predicted protein [Paramuricea clavata]
MYNQGSDHEKIDMSSEIAPTTPPGYPALQRQPSEGAYPPPGAYPSFPVQQQPTNTVHNTNTTVVIQQQPAAVIVQGQRGWSTGMCACFDDCGVCLLGLCCPCILLCTVSSNAGECCCVAALCPIALRTKIRTRHNIAGSIVGDYYALQCCGICAMCQMARELNIHGI